MTSDYKVGYKKPPEHTRFKPGQSGNLRGRRGQRSTDMVSGLTEALSTPVTLREGARTRRVSTIEALFYRMRQQALNGDPSAYDMLMQAAVGCGLVKPAAQADPNPRQGGILLVPDQATNIEEWRNKYNENRVETLEEMEIRLGRPVTANDIRELYSK